MRLLFLFLLVTQVYAFGPEEGDPGFPCPQYTDATYCANNAYCGWKSGVCTDKCAGGEASVDGYDPCTLCGTGQYSQPWGATTCSDCTAGKFNAQPTGVSVCSSCTAGRFQPLEGQSSCFANCLNQTTQSECQGFPNECFWGMLGSTPTCLPYQVVEAGHTCLDLTGLQASYCNIAAQGDFAQTASVECEYSLATTECDRACYTWGTNRTACDARSYDCRFVVSMNECQRLAPCVNQTTSSACQGTIDPHSIATAEVHCAWVGGVCQRPCSAFVTSGECAAAGASCTFVNNTCYTSTLHCVTAEAQGDCITTISTLSPSDTPCIWDSGTSQCTPPCDAIFNNGTCDGRADCRWNATQGICEEHPYACATYATSSKCPTSRCHWTGATCADGVSCPNQNTAACTSTYANECRSLDGSYCWYNSTTCSEFTTQSLCGQALDAHRRSPEVYGCEWRTSTGRCQRQCPSYYDDPSGCAARSDCMYFEGYCYRNTTCAEPQLDYTCGQTMDTASVLPSVQCQWINGVGCQQQCAALNVTQCAARSTDCQYAGTVCLRVGVCTAQTTQALCTFTHDSALAPTAYVPCVWSGSACQRPPIPSSSSSSTGLSSSSSSTGGEGPSGVYESAGVMYPGYTRTTEITVVANAGVLIGQGQAFQCTTHGRVTHVWMYRVANSDAGANFLNLTLSQFVTAGDPNFDPAAQPPPPVIRLDSIVATPYVNATHMQRVNRTGWYAYALPQPRRIYAGQWYVVQMWGQPRGARVQQSFGVDPRPQTNAYLQSLGGVFPGPGASVTGPFDVNYLLDLTVEAAPVTTTPPAWQPPSTPPPLAVSTSTSTTTTVLVVSLDPVVFGAATSVQLAQQLVYELGQLTNVGNATSVTTLSVDPVTGQLQANVTVDLTIAQVLQTFMGQFQAGQVSLDATTFPILGRTTQVVVFDPPALQTQQLALLNISTDVYDTQCGTYPVTGVNCRPLAAQSIVSQQLFAPVCSRGLCGCQPRTDGTCDHNTLDVFVPEDDTVCVAGTILPGVAQYPDVCVAKALTADTLVYRTTDRVPVFGLNETTGATVVVATVDADDDLPEPWGECARRDPRSYNLFPKRRYCQSVDYAYGLSGTVVTGVFGNLRNTSAPARVFTLHFALPPQEVLFATPNVAAAVKTIDGYVSNLYDDQEPLQSKVFARAEFVQLFNEQSVQLTRLVLLDTIEGAREYYYENAVSSHRQSVCIRFRTSR